MAFKEYKGQRISLPVMEFGENRIALVATDVEGCVTHAKRTKANHLGMMLLEQYCAKVQQGYEDSSQKQYPPIMLVTGRASPFLEYPIVDIGARGSAFRVPSVIENGCAYYDHNERRVLGYHPLVSARANDFKKVRKFVDKLLEGVDEWKELRDIVVEEPGKTVCISLNALGSSGLSVKSLYEVIKERFEEKGLDELMDITHSETAVDITPNGVNKRTGLIHLFETCGINPEFVLGVGDTIGDLGWLKYIGIPACPSNATTELLNKFERIWVSDYPDSMGLHNIIQHFIIRPSQN